MGAACRGDKGRLKVELKKVEVEINEEKTRVVDVRRGGSFGFLGFDLREAKSRWGKRFILRTPKRKKQQELLRRVSDILKYSRHRGDKEVISFINPVIEGWMNYFRVGNSARVFDRLRSEVMRRVRRFAMRQRGRHGFGWKRWSNETIYRDWGLLWKYQVQYFYRSPVKVLPAH